MSGLLSDNIMIDRRACKHITCSVAEEISDYAHNNAFNNPKVLERNEHANLSNITSTYSEEAEKVKAGSFNTLILSDRRLTRKSYRLGYDNLRKSRKQKPCNEQSLC